MENKKNKLGKGLSSLLSGKSFVGMGEDSLIDSMNTELKIGITKMEPNPGQPRQNFNKEELENLTSSIKEKGIITPILLRKKPKEEKYEIVAGERRWRAAQLAGLHEVPVIIRKLPDKEAMEIALIENVQRENLNPIEEAKAYETLSRKFKYKHEDLSRAVGKSRSYIINMIRLLELPDFVVSSLIEGKLTIGHARPLIGLANAEELAKQIINKKLSAREAEKLSSQFKNNKKKKVISSTSDPNIKDLEEELADKIGLKTSITFNKESTSGSITVYYSNLDQLDDIMRRLKIKK